MVMAAPLGITTSMSRDLLAATAPAAAPAAPPTTAPFAFLPSSRPAMAPMAAPPATFAASAPVTRSEEHTSELQSRPHLVCRLLLENSQTVPRGGCPGAAHRARPRARRAGARRRFGP